MKATLRASTSSSSFDQKLRLSNPTFARSSAWMCAHNNASFIEDAEEQERAGKRAGKGRKELSEGNEGTSDEIPLVYLVVVLVLGTTSISWA